MRSPKALAAAVVRRIVCPFVPPRKMLPFMCWLNRMSTDYDPYIAHLDLFSAADRNAVDIGANVGFYTYILSERFRRVFAFEINDEITGWIKQYDSGNIELADCGLSSAKGTAKLHLPVTRGYTISGYGTLHPNTLPEADRYIEKICRISPLDDSSIEDIGFIKIDVEGHELEVLKGAAKSIARSRPAILVEVRTFNEIAVDDWFKHLDYRQCRFDPQDRLVVINGFLPSTGDCLYLPSERLGEFGLTTQ
jgi:FkbM family methyltransferase